MNNQERKIMEKQINALINCINAHFEPEVSVSAVAVYGSNPTNIGQWELEALLDDLISIENDRN